MFVLNLMLWLFYFNSFMLLLWRLLVVIRAEFLDYNVLRGDVGGSDLVVGRSNETWGVTIEHGRSWCVYLCNENICLSTAFDVWCVVCLCLPFWVSELLLSNVVNAGNFLDPITATGVMSRCLATLSISWLIWLTAWLSLSHLCSMM